MDNKTYWGKGQKFYWDKESEKFLTEEEFFDKKDRIFDSSAYVIPDDMADTFHPATGEIISSKREFRRITRAHGCEEIGNDVLGYSQYCERKRSEKQEPYRQERESKMRDLYNCMRDNQLHYLRERLREGKK